MRLVSPGARIGPLRSPVLPPAASTPPPSESEPFEAHRGDWFADRLVQGVQGRAPWLTAPGRPGDAQSVADTLWRGAEWLEGRTDRGVDRAERAASDLGHDVIEGIHDFKDAVQHLRIGDEIYVQIGGDLTLPHTLIGAEADLNIYGNQDGTFTISAGLDQELGLQNTVGAVVGAGAQTGVKTTLTGGAKLEATLNSKDEVKELLGLRGRKSAEHVRRRGAIELHGTAATNLAALVGLPARFGRVGAMTSDARVATTLVARVEFAPGRAPLLVLKELIRADTNLSAVTKATRGALVQEWKVQLPLDVDFDRLLDSPISAVRSVASKAWDSLESSTTASIDVSGIAGKAGARIEVRLTSGADEIWECGAGKLFAAGKVQEALERLGSEVQVEIKVSPLLWKQLEIHPMIKIMGVGARLFARVGLKRLHGKPVLEYKGSAKEACHAVAEACRKLADFDEDDERLAAEPTETAEIAG